MEVGGLREKWGLPRRLTLADGYGEPGRRPFPQTCLKVERHYFLFEAEDSLTGRNSRGRVVSGAKPFTCRLLSEVYMMVAWGRGAVRAPHFLIQERLLFRNHI